MAKTNTKKGDGADKKQQTPVRASPRKRPAEEPSNAGPSKKGKKVASPQQAKHRGFTSKARVPTEEPKHTEAKEQIKKTTFNYKCNLKAVYKVARELQNDITEEQKKMLFASPFGPLFKAVTSITFRKENVIEKPNKAIYDLLYCFDKQSQAFNIGGKMIQFTPGDVALLLGVPMEGQIYEAFPTNVTLDATKDQFLSKYFRDCMVEGKALSFGGPSIEKALHVAARTKAPAIEFLKLWIMYMAATFLFASAAGSSVVGSFYHNLQTERMMKRVSWARAIHSYMMERINKHSEDPAKASGCLTLLPYWYCMHTRIHGDLVGEVGVSPRIARWMIEPFFLKGLEEELESITEEQVKVELVAESVEEEELLKFTERVVEEMNEEEVEKLKEEVERLREENLLVKRECERVKRESEMVKREREVLKEELERMKRERGEKNDVLEFDFGVGGEVDVRDEVGRELVTVGEEVEGGEVRQEVESGDGGEKIVEQEVAPKNAEQVNVEARNEKESDAETQTEGAEIDNKGKRAISDELEKGQNSGEGHNQEQKESQVAGSSE